MIMRKAIVLSLMLCGILSTKLHAQSAGYYSGERNEQSVVASWVYAMNFFFNVPNSHEFAVMYLLDHNITNTPLFVEIGASLGYSYHIMGDNKAHAPYVGIPMGVGFHENIGKYRLNPFFRIEPLIGIYKGKGKDWNDSPYTINDTVFGGVAPELGASLNIGNIVVSLSLPMLWDTSWASYSRCGQMGLNIGVGYHF